MIHGKTYQYILEGIEKKGALFFLLLDPDKTSADKIDDLITHIESADVDALLIGGSLILDSDFNDFVKTIKSKTKIPVVIFPGGVEQVSPYADAILFLSIISGRNPENLIGKHVIAAPLIKRINLEPISTAYILVESGKTTTAEFLSNSKPIPRHKPDLAAAHALAAEYLGMKLIYLEAGSGAELSVPEEMIYVVSKMCSVPIIVGGGIRSPEVARKKVEAGAKIIVVGNHFDNHENFSELEKFTSAVHYKLNRLSEV
ncbi:MAG: geranylgeranylglyceryl/heptaprenylglyceryl phosphate synthase [Ignavibacteria bacterium]|nr:geranylgeranylglyceryl/heptaprenylglyceryl phosphate synthase [Ignavibacteria bacterium]